MQQEKTYSVAGYASMSGIERSTVYRQIKAGRLKTKTERGKLCVVVQEEIPDGDVAEPVEDLTEIVALLREQIREKDAQLKVLLERQAKLDDTIQQQNEAIQQQNAIVMQMTRNTETAQRLLEYHETPFFRRLFKRRKSGELVE